MIPIPTAVYKYAAIAVALGIWTYGNRWQSVQSTKHEYKIEQAEREGTAKESQRLNERAAINSKESYEKQLETIKHNANNYRGADRLRESKPVSKGGQFTAPADTSNPARTPPAPQLEWLN